MSKEKVSTGNLNASSQSGLGTTIASDAARPDIDGVANVSSNNASSRIL